ncbi:unnamed protein product [Nesidiocoris tenuis]|uniref:Cadherin domain-containing protein n=1 Tax=Nesidiocoris tenuis TaxID=355587 RepID=A0A6H5GSV3_9HEMI|nr:unnamed protein product [Nesidiocoris tenuis]
MKNSDAPTAYGALVARDVGHPGEPARIRGGRLGVVGSWIGKFAQFTSWSPKRATAASPPRSTRSTVRIFVSDVNDNSPEIVDPQEDVVSVREEQAPGTEVVRVRAVDRDNGPNATVTYSILKGREGEGWRVFSIDPVTGILRTRIGLDAGEKDIYRVTIAATDSGTPPRQSVRTLSVEVMALYDHRPTFSSSSLHFKVSEDVGVGYVVGNVVGGREGAQANLLSARARAGHLMYSLTSVSPSDVRQAFDLDRSSGSLVVTRNLDRESCSEYRLEVRALDTSTTINHQSSAVIIKVEVTDVNDNTPTWGEDVVNLDVPEDLPIGRAVFNFTATDSDASPNGDIRYSLVKIFPDDGKFALDPLTGALILQSSLDFEETTMYVVVVRATDQAVDASLRLSSTLTANIKIRDVNDNSPKFVLPMSKTIHVKEGTEMGETIAKVLAVDRDSGEFGRIAYVISSSNAVGLISLGYETGILSVMKPLTHHAKYNINITASDHASPPKTGTISLTVEVVDSAEAPPSFLQESYSANVPEDATVGTYVTKVEAKSPVEGNSNITYSLASEAFSIHPLSGVVSVSGLLDREVTSSYVLVVYAAEGDHYSATTLTIWIDDVNDHAPRFAACYSLRVPENSEFGVIHRLQAVDMDAGSNAEITYSITGGNIGNRFSIDLHSGELTARSLDRESQSRYRLIITAMDKGNPAMSGTCNLTIVVEDQNDNDPVFSQSLYSGRVPENTPAGTLVLNVSASDQDQDLNGRITYSLANDSDALFRIEPTTGYIYTTGAFDREKKSLYVFQVVATDSGRYDTRSEKVPIHITIEDVNDNKPVFSRYPFTANIPVYSPSGKELLRVVATDADEGANAEVVFSFHNEPLHNKFRIDPKTGVVTSTSTLAMESGKMFHLDVVAMDRGNPPQSSNCLVEITVGDIPDHVPSLRFQNSSYSVSLQENSPRGTEVLQVSAVRTDGRRQQISYRLVAGNENGYFQINPQTGLIRVSDTAGALDYETSPHINMTVQALGESVGGSALHGYAQITINLADLNDNPPLFSQAQYSTTVWEGNSKGTFVMQVSATDKDQGSNSQLLYHIVDGNHDNAFIIEPSSSGIVKVNIVLDREIRDKYRLTIIATDEGVPQLTGTATILVDIVDVNDNQPTFPHPSVVTINEGKEVGSVLTTVTANDVDTNPALTYNISSADGSFSIDRFSGKVTLCQKLDFETKKEYKIGITASDTAHVAHTHLTIIVSDDNDNIPIFSQQYYHAYIPDNSEATRCVLTVSASDGDSDKNAHLSYTLVHKVSGFEIGSSSGEISVNLTAVDLPADSSRIVDLLVRATDSGKPSLSAVVPVRIRIGVQGSRKANAIQKEFKPHGDLILMKPLDRESVDFYTLKVVTRSESPSLPSTILITIEDSNDNAPQFEMASNSVNLDEDVPVGHSVIQLQGSDEDLPPNSDVTYDIISGNDEQLFKIDQQSGLISVSRELDYDVGFSTYALVVSATDRAVPPERPLFSITTIEISLKDANDNSPSFPVNEYLEFVGENEPIGSTVFTAYATDMDAGVYGRLNYSIESSSSSDVEETWKLFRVDAQTGLVTTNSVFDYETRSRYAFTLIAMDSGAKKTKVRVRIEIESRDEFYPQFTERTYRFVVTDKESPVGYVVGNVIATDRDKGPDGRIVYQLTNQHPYFKVNRTTGAIMIKKKIDSNLNKKQEVSFVVRASSGRQESLTNMTVVEISFDPLAGHETNLVKAAAGVTEGEDGLSNNAAQSTSTGKVADWAIGLLISLIIVILCFGAVFLFLHIRNRRQKNVNKSGLGSVGQAGADMNTYVDPGAFDTIPVRGPLAGPAAGGGQGFGPPKYEEIPTYRNKSTSSAASAAATTSQISGGGSDKSGSSGRGSAEDGDDVEDEEIRMINEGIQRETVLHRDAGNSDEDNLSDVSVQNTKEYLARLGIVNSIRSRAGSGSRRRTDSVGAGSGSTSGPKDTIMLHATTVPAIDGLRRMFDDEDATAEAEINNLIYSNLEVGSGSGGGGSERGNEGGAVAVTSGTNVIGRGPYANVQGTHHPSMTGSLSSIVHSEEELTGSYNWDYLLDWGPQYQPLAHVFSEIARLKDDAASVKSGTSGTSSGKGKCPPSIKSVPPPLLTSVAPRSIAAPPVIGSRHHPPMPHSASKMHLLPRSPINHDNAGAVYGPSAPMSPSFSPALSPLATSPSLSPIVTPRHPTSSHHVRPRKATDNELRI